jgi:hypothetical protein
MKTTYKLLIGSLLAIVGACTEPDYPEAVPVVTTLSGRIISFNSVAKRDTVDVTLDNNMAIPLVNDLKYGQALSYRNVQAGPNRLVEYLNADNDTTFFTDRFSVVGGLSYTSVFFKNVALTGGKVTYGVRRITDDVLVGPDPGTAKVRFLNFLYDAPTVTPPSLKLTNVGGTTTLFSARAYANLGASNAFTTFSVVPSASAADYELRTAADVVLATLPITFASKGTYTIIAHGLLSGTGANAPKLTVITH